MIDQDGTFAHSRLITLEFEKSIFLHDNYLFPNPASNVISITLEDRNGETVMVNLKDHEGSTILNGLFKVENDKISLDVSNIKISPGLHIISVITKNKVFNVKLVKE